MCIGKHKIFSYIQEEKSNKKIMLFEHCFNQEHKPGGTVQKSVSESVQWFIVSDLEIHSYRISCVFVFLTVQNIIFDVLGPLAFRKYSTCWVFPALHHSVFVYLCLCICVFVYLTVQNIIFDVLGSLAFQKYKYI